MKKHRIKISEQDFTKIQELVFVDLPKEAGVFALAGVAKREDGFDIIVRRPIEIPRNLFSVHHEFRFEVSSQAINGLVALCERNGLTAVLCHSHPEDIPYSPSDDYGEKRIYEVLRQFLPQKMPMASVLFYPEGLRSRIWLPDTSKPESISEVMVVGRRIKRIQSYPSFKHENESYEDMFDRQIRAFGDEGQRFILRTKIGIVGLGSTGSPCAEQIVRLGVRDIVLIDPDKFEPSNITRMYGSFAYRDKVRWPFRGKTAKKVDIIGAHLRRINPNIKIQIIPRSVVLSEAAEKLIDRDIIFLCTDDHWGRSIVNQIAYQYFIPTINVGMRIAAKEKDGKISEAFGVVDVLRPDLPCLWCRQYLRPERIATESMPRSARQSREREGYVEDIYTPAPSVISITTALSGLAVTLFLQLVTDFLGPNGDIARLNYFVMDGNVRRGRATILNECVCQKVRGFGDLKSLSTQNDISFLGA
jgi:hypothetical protein